jgi:hypothetical protein
MLSLAEKTGNSIQNLQFRSQLQENFEFRGIYIDVMFLT